MRVSTLPRDRACRRWPPGSSRKPKQVENHRPTSIWDRRRLMRELHNGRLLERVNYSRIFPWVTQEMEILPGDTVLVYTSLQGILYNSNLLPKDKAPKTYEDLVDPKLSRSWEGKMAIPPYSSWLVELSLLWGEKKSTRLSTQAITFKRRSSALW